MGPLYSSVVVLVFISHVYALPKLGFPSKKPAVYRPTYCLTLPFNSNCMPLTPLWYYDPQLKTCVPISAGYRVEGANKFTSLKKCSEMCESRAKVTFKQCLTPPTTTAGAVLRYAWYFDEFTKFCKMFTFHTCTNTNGNYFASELKCESVCLPKMKPTPLCSADPIRDTCLFQRKHFFFSFKNNTCMQFPKKGCGKGSNSFASMAKCMDTCSSKMKPTPHCSADPYRHLCATQKKHYFFSFKSNRCMPFPKKGCGKGTNSFVSIAKCMGMCSYSTY
ncbi:tissue factor pathway inhibitor 2 [Rhipicephalus sanguineus]|uniref:tissue factor pathway inhibitor 2 n=1 Tax=Rhipicephalus sanguineus TaxID=34632 RepID=UPI001893007D|nr:tissue factor pathway inhibitor 2 [Rhipicephalus sanguineus]